MALNVDGVKALVFDYGNTLIAFGRQQIDTFDAALRGALEREFGPLDTAAYNARRNADRMAPFTGDPPVFRESDVLEMTAGMVREVYGVTPDSAALDCLLRVRRDAFVSVVRAEEHVFTVLDRLRARFRLGILSNYPDGVAIRESLDETGLAAYFERVGVSGDIGWCKPHPAAFKDVLDGMGLCPEEILFIGDNWLADVQGARRAGMRVVHFRRWVPPEHFEPQPDDLPPHAEIMHLEELPALLGL